MPDCGSQVILCDLPIRMDTYKGCSHNCKYCFTYRKYDISNIVVHDGPESLSRFISGQRTQTTNWCDWNIPLHIGGLSDPFQPVEKIKRVTYECLKILAKTKYPFVISTKSTLAASTEYFEILKNCNFVYQVSMLCSEYDQLETGAPPYEERLKSLKKISPIAKRVVVRLQPYIADYHFSILNNIKRLKDVGVYGVVVEGIKMQKKLPGLIKIGADFCYPKAYLNKKFTEIKKECHKNNLVFLCGENRLRNLGDSLTCCGTEGLSGFKHNYANLNHYVFDKENYKFSEQMKKAGTAYPFKALLQKAGMQRTFEKMSYAAFMQFCEKDKEKIKIFLGEDLM